MPRVRWNVDRLLVFSISVFSVSGWSGYPATNCSRVSALNASAERESLWPFQRVVYADFIPIEPYGSLGDRKNDGYIPETGTFFQLYAPKAPKDKLGPAAAKAKRDFAGLKSYWHSRCPILHYRFAFNDNYAGSVVPLETVLLDLAKDHGITARPFLCKDVETEAMRLNLGELQAVLGTLIPDPGLLPDADYNAVKEVVEHVLNTAAPFVPQGKLLTPAFDEKIEFNGLSAAVGRLLGAAALQNDVVDDYFSLRSGTLRQDLRDHVAAIYATERDAAAADGSGPDAIFFGVLTKVTPKAVRMPAAVQQAALVVLAYYFEACDWMEGPDASA